MPRLKSKEFSSAAAELNAILNQEGFEAFWVGGAVRDLLLGKEISDVDIATSAKPEEIKRILTKYRLRFFAVGEKFGTIGLDFKGNKIEITTFRTESNYKDFRHPEKVKFTDDPANDASRRDFTINAIYLNPNTEEILDFYNGQQDLKHKTIRFVGKPKDRIKEDPLRMLRAVRFAARLNFKISVADFVAIKKYSRLLKKISAERILYELDLIFSDRNFVRGVELLDETGLLKIIFPEVDNLKKVAQSKNVHAEGSGFIHSLLALRASADYDLDLRYAAFLHDIGKKGTAKKTTREGRPHISFHGHAPLGAQRFIKIGERLKFPSQRRDKIYYLIKHHMDLLHPDLYSEKTLIKTAQKPYFHDLVRLRIADSKASTLTDAQGRKVKKDYQAWHKLLALDAKVQKAKTKILIDGREVMKIKKIKPGPKVGKILQQVRTEQIRGKIKTKLDAQKFVKTLDKDFE